MTNNTPQKNIIVLSAAWPYGQGEGFLEKELPILAGQFDRIIILPMFSDGIPCNVPERVILLSSGPPSTCKLLEMLRGMRLSGGMLFSEWKQSPGFPFSPHRFIQIARTLGIARRIERRVIETARIHNLQNGIIYSYWMNQACLGGILAAQRLGWPVVSRTHGGDLYTERHPANYLPWHEWKVQNLNHIFTISEHGKSYLSNRYPYAASKIMLQRLGATEFPASSHIPGSGEVFHVASCSSVIPLKRVDLILQTVAALKRKLAGRAVRWTHFGDGPAFEALQKQSKQHSEPGLDINLKGHVANEAITDFYRNEKVDLFINYSTSEGIPVSVMEAFCCGIPVAAPAVGGIPELVTTENGILFNADTSPEELVEHILAVMESDKLHLMGKNARKKWALEYHLEKNYRAFARMLSGIKNE